MSPVTAANNAKNLGEVSLRKHGVAVARSHVAVVHISRWVEWPTPGALRCPSASGRGLDLDEAGGATGGHRG